MSPKFARFLAAGVRFDLIFVGMQQSTQIKNPPYGVLERNVHECLQTVQVSTSTQVAGKLVTRNWRTRSSFYSYRSATSGSTLVAR